MTIAPIHESVLLHESVDALILNREGIYVDGTFGRGGHSNKMLEQLSVAGRLYAFDKDEDAVACAADRFSNESRFKIFHSSFADMLGYLKSEGAYGKVDGILLDLGVSSPQLDEAERGFSFMRDGPLDMRMNHAQELTAAKWLKEADLSEIRYVLHVHGEERFAALIAKKIVERREAKPFLTTLDLAGFISEVVPKFDKKKHPATRSFQAIRIHINQELEDLKRLLDSAVELLNKDGRLVIISFHSLEDRIVKQFLRAQDKGPKLPRYLPITDAQIKRGPHLKIIGKAIKASDDEVSRNVRARSAIMRVARKVMS